MCFNMRRKSPQRRGKEGTKKATPPEHRRKVVEGSPKDRLKKAPQVAVLGGWLSLFVLPQRIEL